MSSFLNSLLGQQGCNIDGTASGTNPLTSVVDRLFETSSMMMGGGSMNADPGAGGLTYYDSPSPNPMGMQFMQQQQGLMSMGGNFHGSPSQSMEAAWAQAQQLSSPQVMGGMGMGMGMGSAHPMMQMQMQQYQMAMMHQRSMMMNMHQQQLHAQQEQQENSDQVGANAWSDDGRFENQKSEIERAIESTMNGDEPLGVERLEEIWNSFGIESGQQSELLGAAGSSKHASYPEGASAEGYREAWNKIAARLETPPVSNKYQFLPNNPYVSAERGEEVLPTHAQQTTQETNESLLERGMALFSAGCVSEAILAFEAVVQANPDVVEGWLMLGKCHAESDDDKKAIVSLEKAVECDPYNLPALLSLGTSYVNELDSVRALETLKAWVTHNPDFAGFSVKHDEYSDGTLMDEVTQLMLSAAEHSPHSVDVHVVLGVLYNISLDHGVAAEHFQRAMLTAGSTDYSIRNKLGATLANSNRSAEAVPLYAMALQQRPAFARGWLNLGIAFANLNKYTESAKAYLQALHLNPGAKHIWGYLRVVLSCLERLDLVEAIGAAGLSQDRERQLIDQLAAALAVDLISEPNAASVLSAPAVMPQTA